MNLVGEHAGAARVWRKTRAGEAVLLSVFHLELYFRRLICICVCFEVCLLRLSVSVVIAVVVVAVITIIIVSENFPAGKSHLLRSFH